MARVFVSYRHVEPDQSLARALEAFLATQGVGVFLDARIEVGMRWVEEIEHQLASSQFFVVLLSKDSILSDMVRREIRMAHDLERRGELRILPVRVGFEGELPYDLGAYLDPIQYAVWRAETPFEPVCQAIGRAILHQESLGPEREADHEPAANGLDLLAAVTETLGAPLPVADPRLETGTLEPSSPFYVKRPEDARIEALVGSEGRTLVIKAPRQFGKSSLMARAASLARERGVKTCLVDFQLIDEGHLTTLDALCRFLAHKLARGLRTSFKPQEVWDEHLGPKESLTLFIEETLLAEPNSTVYLCFDEADRVFDRDYRDDFFSAVRGWHNQRATVPVWKRLGLLIVHATDSALWIKNLNLSPFNVGERLRLAPFAAEHVEELNRRHGAPLETESEIRQLLDLVGGQPYLVRKALYVLATGQCSFAEMERTATDDRGPFGDHLRYHLAGLRRDTRSLRTLRQVLRTGACDDELDFERLAAAGLVRGKSRRSATLGCDLYQRYFREHL